MHAHGDCHPHFGGFFMNSGGRRFGRHHGPPPWFFHMMGGGPRAEKGEVRYLILDALRDEARHGYDIIQTIEKRSGGGYKPSPGTVYPTLQLLEEMGHVSSRKEANRTIYEITDEGRADLDDHQDEVDEAYDRFGGEAEWTFDFDFRAVGSSFRKVMRSIRSAVRHGRLGQSEMKAILDELEAVAARIETIVRKK